MSYFKDSPRSANPDSIQHLIQHPNRSERRRVKVPLLAGIVVACIAAVAGISYLAPALTGGPILEQPAQAPPTPITYWPSASNTGVPPGTTLRNSGGLSLRTDNQHVTGLNITGCVNVHARNVRITKSKINCGSPAYAIRTLNTAVNLIVEDVEINGLGQNAVTICCGNYTLRRVNMYGMTDGPRLGTNTAVIDSYIHDLARLPGTHNDALQITGGSGVVVRHNTLQVYDAATRDPMNACIMVGSETAPSTNNMVFEDNYCDGGNWSIGVRTDLVATNLVFRNNKFGRNYRYGIIARPNQRGITWERSNVWFNTGLPVVP